MFPGPHAQIYRNEAGEPIGWDYPSDEPFEEDFEDAERRYQHMRCEGCGLHPEDCECDDGEHCTECDQELDDGFCENPKCSRYQPDPDDCPRGCGETRHNGPCKED